MKKYYFNYEITGTKTILPLFIAAQGINKVEAYKAASQYLLSINKNTIVHEKEYEAPPKDLAHKYSVKTIPAEFYQKTKTDMPTNTPPRASMPGSDEGYARAKKQQRILIASTCVGLLGGYMLSTKIFGKENHFARMAGTIIGGVVGYMAPDLINDLTTVKNTTPGKPIEATRTS